MPLLTLQEPQVTFSYREIMDRPGCYLDLANGNILRNLGTTAQARNSRDPQTDRKVFVLLTDDPGTPETDLRAKAIHHLGVNPTKLGRVVVGHSHRTGFPHS